MGLSADIQRAVGVAFTAIGDLATSTAYWSTGTPTYNATTGAVTRNETKYDGVRVVFMAYRRDEIDGDIVRPEDQKCLIVAAGLAITPTLNDRLIDRAGVSWEVIGIRQDPAGALWSLQVRRP